MQEMTNEITLCGRLIRYINSEIEARVGGKLIRIIMEPNSIVLEVGDLFQVKGRWKDFEKRTFVCSEITILTRSILRDYLSINNQLPREAFILLNQSAWERIRLRSKILVEIRKFLHLRGFDEVETPILTKVPTIAETAQFSTNSGSTIFYLRNCPEEHLKRLVVAGFEKIFEIAKSFRNEVASDTHLPEFTLLECYQAYSDYHDMMHLTENLILHIVIFLTGDSSLVINGIEIDFSIPWKRIDVTDYILKKTGINIDEIRNADVLRNTMCALGFNLDENLLYGDLVNLLIVEYIEPNLVTPTFLMDYPMETICVAKRKTDKPHQIERFEGYIRGIEVAHGYSELADPIEQRERFLAARDEKVAKGFQFHDLDEEFLQALSIGLPPTSGLGIGIDRLIMLLTGCTMSEVVMFPYF